MFTTSSGQAAPLRLCSALKGLLLLLSACGLIYSALSAWTLFAVRDLSSAARLQAALPWHERLGLDTRPLHLALAELSPAEERHHLELAVAGPRPPVDALVRLSLLEEFAGQQALALQYMDQALHRAKRYKVFVSAASQAARLDLEDRVLEIAAQGLPYAPSAADDLFLLLQPLARAQLSLARARPEQRIDYLRFLIGQKDYLRALEYQSALPDAEAVDRLRRELAERLILLREWDAVDRLYPPGAEGVQNGGFTAMPTSLAFDWRLAQGNWLHWNWRAGLLSLEVEALPQEREVLSQYVRLPSGQTIALHIEGSGDVDEFRWRVESLAPHWFRISCVAKAGASKRVDLRQVRGGPSGE